MEQARGRVWSWPGFVWFQVKPSYTMVCSLSKELFCIAQAQLGPVLPSPLLALVLFGSSLPWHAVELVLHPPWDSIAAWAAEPACCLGPVQPCSALRKGLCLWETGRSWQYPCWLSCVLELGTAAGVPALLLGKYGSSYTCRALASSGAVPEHALGGQLHSMHFGSSSLSPQHAEQYKNIPFQDLWLTAVKNQNFNFAFSFCKRL